MARKALVEFKCDRCARIEYVEEKENGKAKAPTVSIQFDGRSVVFEDLCAPCTNTVANLIENISKMPKGRSPERGAKKNQSESTDSLE